MAWSTRPRIDAQRERRAALHRTTLDHADYLMRSLKGVNIGSSFQVVDGWLSLDHSKHVLIARVPGAATVLHSLGLMPSWLWPYHQNGAWRRVRFWDARLRIPLKDGAVQYAYSAHTLEHFYPDHAARVAAGILRVLKPGGVFRVVLPDLEAVATSHHALTREAPASFRDGQVTREGWADAVSEFCFGARTPMESRFRHRWMYDRHSIKRLLLKVGFATARDCAFRSGQVPDLESLDTENRRAESLYVEAVK